MFENEPDLLTRKQVQDLLAVGKNTILKLISNGYLPAIVIAGSYRIKKNDLIDFIEKSMLENYSKNILKNIQYAPTNELFRLFS